MELTGRSVAGLIAVNPGVEFKPVESHTLAANRDLGEMRVEDVASHAVAEREHVRAILPDSMADLTKMLSGLRRQEAIFVGQAAVLPSRILIRSLTQEQLPRSNDIDFDKAWQSAGMTEAQLIAIANKWRYRAK